MPRLKQICHATLSCASQTLFWFTACLFCAQMDTLIAAIEELCDNLLHFVFNKVAR